MDAVALVDDRVAVGCEGPAQSDTGVELTLLVEVDDAQSGSRFDFAGAGLVLAA